MRLFILLTVVVLLVSCSSQNDTTPSPGTPVYTVGTIQIQDPWSTGGIHDGAGAAYCTFVNTGTEPDTLLAVSSPAAERVELHEMIEQDGIRKMQAVHNLVLSPNDPAILKPGGTHLMLLSLHDTQRKGDTLGMSFTFSRAGSITVPLPVR